MSAYPYRTVHADGTELLCGYDGLGRKLWEEDDTGRTEYAYNRSGWQIMERDGEGHETHRLYDGSGRLTALYSPRQWAAGIGKSTEYRYDYGGENQMLRIHHPDGGVERFFYDGTGNPLKRVLPEQYDEDTDDGAGYTYTYDKEGRSPVLEAIGKMNERNNDILEVMLQHGLNLDKMEGDMTLKEMIESFHNDEMNKIIVKYYSQ